MSAGSPNTAAIGLGGAASPDASATATVNANANATPPIPPNAPRGPAAMRNVGGAQGGGSPANVAGGAAGGGAGQPARYTTQGQARSRPY